MRPSINVMLMGRSGAGKSSLANYLYGDDIFKTGEGSPVTRFDEPWQMKTIIDKSNEFNINIYDTPGLEPDNYAVWSENMNEELSKRELPADWMYGAFYVINAASHRIEPTEIEIIKKFPEKYYVPVSIAITNCDAEKDEDIDKLKGEILKQIPNANIAKVCSVKRKKRNGDITEPFGKEELLNDHARKVAFFYIQRMGCLIFGKEYPKVVREIFGTLIDRIKSSDFNIIKLIRKGEEALNDLFDDLHENCTEALEEKVQEFQEKVDKADDYVKEISHGRYSIPYLEMPLDDDAMDEVLERKINEIENLFNSDSISDKLSGIFKIGKMAITAKSTLIDLVRDLRNDMLDALEEKEKKCLARLNNPDKYMDDTDWEYEW